MTPTATLVEELIAALRAGDEARVADAISRGANVDAVEYYDLGDDDRKIHEGARCALSFAIQSGNPALVRQLLVRGANPNSADKFGGRTPIIEAVLVGNHEMVEELLKYRAQPNLCDFCKNALTHAIERGDWGMSKRILQHGGEVQIEAVQYAVRRERNDLLELCLGAEEDTVRNQSLRLAVARQWWDVVGRLLELRTHAADEETGKSGSALADAVRAGDAHKVDLLLACGETAKPRNGVNPLRVAIETGKAELAARLLLANGTLPKKLQAAIVELATQTRHAGLLRLIAERGVYCPPRS